MTAEDKFIHELEVFRTEVQSATQFFYAYLAIHSEIAGNKEALKLVNETPLFWKTNIGALQISLFITLGRIFDKTSKHNIDSLIKTAVKNKNIFSKTSLEARKRNGSNNADEWIDDYMKTVYVPEDADFSRLQKHIEKYRKLYDSNYRKIRNKIFAHKEFSKPSQTQKLFKKTNIRELERIFTFLNKLYEALWQLFNNGRKPILRPVPYSLKSMKKSKTPKGYPITVQEKIVQETVAFFKKNTEKSTTKRSS